MVAFRNTAVVFCYTSMIDHQRFLCHVELHCQLELHCQCRSARVFLVAIRSRPYLYAEHQGGIPLRCSDLFHKTRDRSARFKEQLRTAVLPWALTSAFRRLCEIAGCLPPRSSLSSLCSVLPPSIAWQR
jgi:hypothetical protein